MLKLSISRWLKDRAGELSETDTKASGKIREESDKLFQPAADEFADVKYRRDTVGIISRHELFEIRHLSVGKVVPEIEG